MTIQPSGFFLLRRPVLPLSACALDDDGLREHWSDDIVQEAVYTASPTLYEQIRQAIEKDGWPLPKPLRQSLQKYLLRMSTRSTPFGLFAGCAVGEVAAATGVTFSPVGSLVKHRRLDAACLAGIVRQLNAAPQVRAQVRFYPNDSLYAVGDELRYIEHQQAGQEKHFFTSSVRRSPYLESVLALARTGATVESLTGALVAAEIPAEEAAAFVAELIAQQLLVSGLRTALTEPAPLTALLRQLRRLKGPLPALAALERTAQVLAAVHADGRPVQREVARTLAPHFGPADQAPLIQTDLFFNADTNRLGDACLRTLSRQITRLLPLNQRNLNPQLGEFANRFRSRYDQQEVPLLQVLDNEMGIGYGSTRGTDTDCVALLDGLTFPAPAEPRKVAWGPYENLLLGKLSHALRHRCLDVEVTDAELQSIAPAVPDRLPDNFYLLGSLLAPSAAAIDEGRFTFNLLTAQGPSLANLLGRFCAHSPALTEKVTACLRREEQQNPGVVFAEIIHSPQDRLGNVLTRPALYTYQIGVVSHCSVDEEFRIGLDDLLVSVDAGNRIVLRSRRLQKEVIPRLSTAHNYAHGLPVYQLLCDLQRQSGSLNLHWDWGLLDEQAFLPRVTYGQVILSRARWRIRAGELPCQSADALITHLEAHLLPRWVALAEGDNELVFNLNREADRQLFWEEVRKRGDCQLLEWLAPPEQCWVRDARGVYAHEVVLCGTCGPQAPAARPAPVAPPPEAGREPRVFLPGSEWLYVKIYAGTSTSNRLLRTVLWPLMRKLKKQDKISDWFFVRYADPEPHVRLRCRLNDPRLFAPLVNWLRGRLEACHQAGVVQNVQFDTYEREVERYGQAGMRPSEAIFTADSTATMQYLGLDPGAGDAWLFALRSLDALLTDFDQPLPARIGLLSGLRDALLEEHRADALLRRQLNDRYRLHQRAIDQALTGRPPGGDPAGRVLALRSTAIRAAATQLGAGGSEPSLAALLGSYAHMAMNRLFASQQRGQEMVVYHHLVRHYESRLARGRHWPSPAAD